VDSSDDFYGRVKVLVMDASHSDHSHVIFEEAKKKWGEGSGSPHSQHVEFFEEVTNCHYVCSKNNTTCHMWMSVLAYL
jgi:hypothetical protein